MPVTKTRFQNPVIGDIVQLKLFIFNSNLPAEVESIEEVEIFFLDPEAVTDANPTGKTLIQTIPGAEVTNPATGEYQLDLFLDPVIYTEIGRYTDCWHITFRTGDPEAIISNLFEIFSDLWYTTPIPVVYDFQFFFQPNKIRKGEKKFIEVEVIPNVPRATDLCRYYENLIIAANIQLFLAINCLECVPCENDLRLVIDGAETTFREKNRAFFKIDTTDLDCGVYDIFFRLEFGDNVYISPTNQLQIFA